MSSSKRAMLKVGDLVRYDCPESSQPKLGFITDVMGFDAGWPMYEVVCTEPYDRGWFSDTSLEVVNESR